MVVFDDAGIIILLLLFIPGGYDGGNDGGET